MFTRWDILSDDGKTLTVNVETIHWEHSLWIYLLAIVYCITHVEKSDLFFFSFENSGVFLPSSNRNHRFFCDWCPLKRKREKKQQQQTPCWIKKEAWEHWVHSQFFFLSSSSSSSSSKSACNREPVCFFLTTRNAQKMFCLRVTSFPLHRSNTLCNVRTVIRNPVLNIRIVSWIRKTAS